MDGKNGAGAAGAGTGQASGADGNAAGAAAYGSGSDGPLTADSIAAAGGESSGQAGNGSSGQAGGGTGDAGKDAGAADSGGDAKEGNKGESGEESGDGKDEGSKEAAKDGEAGEWKNLAGHLPENADIDPAMVEEFAKFASEMKLEPDQAKKLIDWQLNAVKQAQDRVMARSMEELAREWGRDTQNNLAKALGVAAMIDRKLGSEDFSKACGRYGIACDKAFVKGMYEISRLLEEDSLGAKHGQSAPPKTETPYEALRGMFG